MWSPTWNQLHYSYYPLEEGLNIVFIARRQYQTESVSCAAIPNLTILVHLGECYRGEIRPVMPLNTYAHIHVA